MKECRNCKQLLPLEEFNNFYTRRTHRDGKARDCRNCANKRLSEWRFNRPLEKRINSILKGIKHRQPTTDLTLTDIIDLWNQQKGKCYYSNIEMDEPGHGPLTWKTASLDKIVPSIGYVKGNIVWCIMACNVGKSDFPKELYLEICKKVAEKYDTN